MQLVTAFRQELMPGHSMVMASKYSGAVLSRAAISQAGVDQSATTSLKLSPLPMAARQALQLLLSAHRCWEKPQAAALLLMQELAILSMRNPDARVALHCCAASMPFPAAIKVKHEAHSGSAEQSCLKKVHMGKAEPPQLLIKRLTSEAGVATHAGERNAAVLVVPLPEYNAARQCLQFWSSKHSKNVAMQLSKTIL